MRFEDTVTIPTPEGVEIELTLAGIGSRFIATLIDSIIKGVVLLALVLTLFGFAGLIASADPGSEGAGWLGVAVFAVVSFLITFGYDVLFETLASGRTPGKRWTGLRVVKVGGHPVGFLASTVRNLMRLVDALPGVYGVGMISIAVTKLNQRLGDVAAGTVVVRERRGDRSLGPISASPVAEQAPTLFDLSTWDVSALSVDDLATVRRFLERRTQLTPQARVHLAAELAERLRPKVGGAPPMPPESFLVCVSLAKAQRS